ncbi:mei-W68, partial [Drosophila busckii]
ELLKNIEHIVLRLVSSLKYEESVTLKIPLGLPGGLKFRRISYNNRSSRHRFCLVLHLLAEIHRLHIVGGSCTIRGLYYRDTALIRSQPYIVAARLDVCRMLNTSYVQIGVLSATKGLISGDIQLIMSNGDVLNCNEYCGAIALPTDFQQLERIVTDADLVLVVEKESIFESLTSDNIFSKYGLRIILITGKGYPDCTTRHIVHRLATDFKIPVYILADADPFGIEIMLVYKHGSQSMSFSSATMATPALRWIGLHPSEIGSVSTRTVPLTQNDNKKIRNILCWQHISLGVRKELFILLEKQLKAEIESVIDFLSCYYLPNKINRNLFL